MEIPRNMPGCLDALFFKPVLPAAGCLLGLTTLHYVVALTASWHSGSLLKVALSRLAQFKSALLSAMPCIVDGASFLFVGCGLWPLEPRKYENMQDRLKSHRKMNAAAGGGLADHRVNDFK